MTKVKLIRETNECTLEERVNEFISDQHVIDIKYQMSKTPNSTVYSALIIYDDAGKLTPFTKTESKPVVHAYWKPMKSCPYEFVCSECGCMWNDLKTTYCHECGALMDLEAK